MHVINSLKYCICILEHFYWDQFGMTKFVISDNCVVCCESYYITVNCFYEWEEVFLDNFYFIWKEGTTDEYFSATHQQTNLSQYK